MVSSNSGTLATFLEELTPETQACKVPSARRAAMDDWTEWLNLYKTRIESEVGEWASEGNMWSEKRREAMRGANPRFVLRQWVLEEVIKKVEEDWKTGRRVLAKALEVRAEYVWLLWVTDEGARFRWHAIRLIRGVGKARKKANCMTKQRKNGGCAAWARRRCWASSAPARAKQPCSTRYSELPEFPGPIPSARHNIMSSDL